MAIRKAPKIPTKRLAESINYKVVREELAALIGGIIFMVHRRKFDSSLICCHGYQMLSPPSISLKYLIGINKNL
jgi:hypothetical protein